MICRSELGLESPKMIFPFFRICIGNATSFNLEKRAQMSVRPTSGA
jgi:preprotein translocase subunit SecB